MRKRKLVERKLVAPEPAKLRQVVAGAFGAAGRRRAPRQAEHGAPVVGLEVDPDESGGGDLEPRLLADLAPQPLERVLRLVEEPAGEVPEAECRLELPPAEEHASGAVDDHGLDARHRVRVCAKPARRAQREARTLLDSLAAARAIPPLV